MALTPTWSRERQPHGEPRARAHRSHALLDVLGVPQARLQLQPREASDQRRHECAQRQRVARPREIRQQRRQVGVGSSRAKSRSALKCCASPSTPSSNVRTATACAGTTSRGATPIGAHGDRVVVELDSRRRSRTPSARASAARTGAFPAQVEAVEVAARVADLWSLRCRGRSTEPSASNVSRPPRERVIGAQLVVRVAEVDVASSSETTSARVRVAGGDRDRAAAAVARRRDQPAGVVDAQVGRSVRPSFGGARGVGRDRARDVAAERAG